MNTSQYEKVKVEEYKKKDSPTGNFKRFKKELYNNH